MQIERIDSPAFMGIPSGIPVKLRLVLNQRERATIERAVAIEDEIRTKISEAMGSDRFEGSSWYTAYIDEWLETAEWYEDSDWGFWEAVRLGG